MTEENDEQIDYVDFVKRVEVSDADIDNTTNKIIKRKRKVDYVMTPARIKQQEEMRKKGWEKRRQAKEVKNQLIQEKLKEYRQKADTKMKSDIVKTAVRIMKQDQAITTAIKKVIGDINYDDIILQRLKALIDGIYTPESHNPPQNTTVFNRPTPTFV